MDEIPTQDKTAAKLRGVVDICFLLDATGSMQPCIDAVRDNIKQFIDTLKSADANGGVLLSDWRACVCAYRDYEYDTSHGEKWLEMNDFTSDSEELHRQLDRLVAKGGGDEPESLLDAIYQVVHRGATTKGEPLQADKWRYRSAAARCLVVMTDASFHEQMSIPGAEGGNVEDIRNLLQQERIRLSLFAPEMSCHYSLSEVDKCEYDDISVPEGSTPQKALADYTTNKDNFQRVMELLAKSITQSASTDTEEL